MHKLRGEIQDIVRIFLIQENKFCKNVGVINGDVKIIEKKCYLSDKLLEYGH